MCCNFLLFCCYIHTTGSQSAYRKIYEEPIVQSRQVEATEKEKEVGQKRAQEVSACTLL